MLLFNHIWTTVIGLPASTNPPDTVYKPSKVLLLDS